MYLSVTLMVALVFVLNIYKKLRQEMLLSNKLLYIIDFESLNETERQIIIRFLVNY